MAEPYIPIASLVPQQSLLTTVEASTIPATSDANALVAATASALASRDSAQALLASVSLGLFLGGG